MRYYQKIVGERLYLSPFDRDDPEIIATWAQWMNDRAVSEFYGGGTHNLVSRADAAKILAGLQGYRFAIVLRDCDTLIGHVSLHDMDSVHRHAFLGIFIGEEARRGKGYGAEAVRLALAFGFQTLNLHNIMLSVHADNYAAIACYRACGFRETGRRPAWFLKNGEWVDQVYMGLLDREFAGRETGMTIEAITARTRPLVDKQVAESWAGPYMVSRGVLHDARRLPGFAAEEDGKLLGFVLYTMAGGDCEIAFEFPHFTKQQEGKGKRHKGKRQRI
jgi:RimJ/RimL family protein N-acetyltransferase